jgi:phage N-6-adenine-methyltransferase
MSLSKAFTTSNDQSWSTPWPIFNFLNSKYDYSIDLCASNTNKKCEKYLGLDQGINSLDVKWHEVSEGRGWANPPYGDDDYPVKDWMEKAYEEYHNHGFSSSWLLPINKQDQKWFHKYCISQSFIEIFEGRIQFVDPITGEIPLRWSDKKQKMVKMGNSQGSMLITFGVGVGIYSLPKKLFEGI